MPVKTYTSTTKLTTMITPPTLKTITITGHEITLLHQSITMAIMDVQAQKIKLADMQTNDDSSALVFEYYAKRHKALEDINKKIFEKP
jgi:hypothetical protein